MDIMNNVKIVINYFKLKNRLKQDAGYSEYEARHTIAEIRKMDSRIKKSFTMWFAKGISPEYSVEDFSFQELTDKIMMNPYCAFLFLDWLTKDPVAAKKSLLRPRCKIGGDADTLKIAEILKDSNEIEIPEDETDIAE